MFPSGSRKIYSLRSSPYTGGLKRSTPSKTALASGDYSFLDCLKRKGFQEIPDTIIHVGRQMIVVFEAQRPHCWLCKQLAQSQEPPSKKGGRSTKGTDRETEGNINADPSGQARGVDIGRKGKRNLPKPLKSSPLPPRQISCKGDHPGSCK